jgi:fluoride ion exporter CrcB/FEX
MRAGHWFEASANVLLSVALCLAAVWAGYAAASAGHTAAG